MSSPNKQIEVPSAKTKKKQIFLKRMRARESSFKLSNLLFGLLYHPTPYHFLSPLITTSLTGRPSDLESTMTHLRNPTLARLKTRGVKVEIQCPDTPRHTQRSQPACLPRYKKSIPVVESSVKNPEFLVLCSTHDFQRFS